MADKESNTTKGQDWATTIAYVLAIGINCVILYDQYIGDGELRVSIHSWVKNTIGKMRSEWRINERVKKDTGKVLFEAMTIVEEPDGNS